MFAKSEKTLFVKMQQTLGLPSAKIDSESQLVTGQYRTGDQGFDSRVAEKIVTLALVLLKRKLGEDFSYTQPQSLKTRVQNIWQYVEHFHHHLMCVVV